MSVHKQHSAGGPQSSPQPRRRWYGLLFLALLGLALVWLGKSNFDQAAIATTNDPVEEIVALDQAMRTYHARWGEYPPNGGDAEILQRHLRLRFPHMAEDETLPRALDAAEALVFWLGGFSASRAYPLSGRGGPLNPDGPRRQGLYAFDPTRLTPTSYGQQVYLPPGLGRTEPYLYFRTTGRRKLNYPERNPRMTPYRASANEYVNRDAFQILSAGDDDRWGALPAPDYPAGPFTGGHADNRANFSARELGAK